VLLIMVPVLDLVFRRVVQERMGTIILSAIVAHTGWHWRVDRAASLRAFQFQWPQLTAALLANVVRWTMIIVLMAGVMWLVSLFVRRRDESERLTPMDRKF
jgi:hypothetical protein